MGGFAGQFPREGPPGRVEGKAWAAAGGLGAGVFLIQHLSNRNGEGSRGLTIASLNALPTWCRL